MPWWQDYFREAWEPMQHLVKTPDTTVIEADFIEALLHEYDYRRVLDVPCGAGRIAIELAKRGFNTVGIEYNPDAVAAAQGSAQRYRQQKRTHFEVGDMRQLSFDAEFDAVLCVFNSFGYFDDADNERFVAGASQSLRPDGMLLLDCHILETLLPAWSPHTVWRFEQWLIVEERAWDLQQSRMNGQWTFVAPDGKQQHYKSSVRVYGFAELKQLLNKYNLHISDIYNGYTGDSYTMGDDSMVLLAHKKA